MHWVQLTQATTGAQIFVNMEQVILIAPTKTGGSALVTSVTEKEAARIIPVAENPREVVQLAGGEAKAS